MTGSTGRAGAFTLIELLVSMVILALILLVLISITDSTSRTWSYTTAKIEEFRQAREAFESLTRRLSQATLRTYWDYTYVNGNPTSYIRQSELRFISGSAAVLTSASTNPNLGSPTHAIFFQAPLGLVTNPTYSNLPNLLNTCGYYINFASDTGSRPPFLSKLAHQPPLRYRYRLNELDERSENLTLYQYTSGFTTTSPITARNPTYFTYPALPGLTLPSTTTPTYTGREWYTAPLTASPPPVRVLADNIIAMVLLPKLSLNDEQSLISQGAVANPLGTNLAPVYSYDSTAINPSNNPNPALDPKNQLPPNVQVTLVAVDDASFSRFLGTATSRPQPDPLLEDSTGAALFTDATKYDADIATLQQTLTGQNPKCLAHLNYRVFTTTVDLKAAKWSRDQKQ